MLFFVLSGYCLAASALRGDRLTDRAQFYIRRVFRIHPPYVAAMCLAWGASLVPRSGPCCMGYTQWIVTYTHLEIPASQFVGFLGFPGPAGGLFPVGWTLEVEMIFSLLLPLIVLVARRGHWTLALLLCGAALAHDSPVYSGQGYAVHFVAGVLLHEWAKPLSRIAARAPATFGLSTLAIAVYFTMIGMHFVPESWNALTWLGLETQRTNVLSALAISSSALTVAAVHIPRVRAALEWRPVAFVGRVSYSLYLLHFTVLLTLLRYVRGTMVDVGVIVFILGVVSVSVALASLMYRWVELPSIRAGNWLCAKLARVSHTKELPSRIV
jgi:peptidoglycan/LPS O-acetylase OafA/YrhL